MKVTPNLLIFINIFIYIFLKKSNIAINYLPGLSSIPVLWNNPSNWEKSSWGNPFWFQTPPNWHRHRPNQSLRLLSLFYLFTFFFDFFTFLRSLSVFLFSIKFKVNVWLFFHVFRNFIRQQHNIFIFFVLDSKRFKKVNAIVYLTSYTNYFCIHEHPTVPNKLY